jgi:MFS family permease
VVALTIRDGALHVLLVRRGAPPQEGRWALPGGFVKNTRDEHGEVCAEGLDAAAARDPAERPPSAAGAGADRGPVSTAPATQRLLHPALLRPSVLAAGAAAADWSAVHLRTAAHAAQDVAAWGYAAFSLAMAGARLAGDRLVERLGSARLVRAAALTGAAGLTLGLLVPVTPVVIVAFAVLGLEMATVVPPTFSAAGSTPGHDPGTAVAAVATVGYGGWMLAPPVIGFVAQGTSLTVALALVAVMTALIAVPADALRASRP